MSPTALLKGLVAGYRYLISPLTGPHCRFHPTCSAYAMEALDQHGAGRGLLLALKRLGRCHPWGGSGHDPVPEPSKPKDFATPGPLAAKE